MPRVVSFVFLVLCGQWSTFAELQPAKIFSDHMVLQRQAVVPIWGLANAEASVTVAFAEQSVATKADGKGRWKAELAPMKASAKGRSLEISSGGERVTIQDVLVGDVWFAGGQSNMDYKVKGMASRLPEGKALAEAANYPAIRHRKVNERNAAVPQPDLSGGAWVVCSPKSVGGFSGVGFVFARRLHLELKIPIGVIDCAWGGTPIEPYVPAKAFKGHPTLVKLAKYAKAGDFEAIKKMPGGTFVRSPAWLAGTIYNGRIAPVAPMAFAEPFGIRRNQTAAKAKIPATTGTSNGPWSRGGAKHGTTKTCRFSTSNCPNGKAMPGPMLVRNSFRPWKSMARGWRSPSTSIMQTTFIPPTRSTSASGSPVGRWPSYTTKRFPSAAPCFGKPRFGERGR